MTENDYIAEYIKEKRPEIIETPSYLIWRIGKTVSNMVGDIIDTFRKIDWSKVDLIEIEKEEQDNDIQGDETKDGIDTETDI